MPTLAKSERWHDRIQLIVRVKVVAGAGATEGLPVPVTVKVYVPAVVP